ncbi:MAG: TonB-dependent receptor [Vicinamibacterales bacterium]
MRRRRRAATALAALLAIALAPTHVAAQAPSTGAIRGRVVDADTGVPLAAVLVVTAEPDRRAVTDADGRFALTDLPVGPRTLVVSLVGYTLARPEVVVPASGAGRDAGGDTLVIPLSPGAGAYTEQLTVRGNESASRPAAPVEFRMRSADLQELRGVLADDPFRAIQAMPGVATGDDFRAEFSVRGSDFRQMGFAVDGVPAPWLVHGPRAVNDTGTVAMLNADVLSEIALTSGASPQIYGNRTGAWVQSTMREGSRDAVRLTGSLSGTGVSGVIEGPLGRGRRGAWLVSARKSYIDWLISRLNLDTQDDSRFGFTDAQSTWVYDVTPTQQVRLSAVAGRSRYRDIDTTPSANGLAVADASTGFAVAAWRSTIGPSVVVTQRFTGAVRRYQNRGDFDQELDHGSESTGGYRADATLGGWHGATVDLGVSADRDDARYRTRAFAGTSAATLALRGTAAWRYDRWRTGGYVRGRLAPASTVAIDAGVRADRDSRLEATSASPWLLTRWSPSARVTLAAGAGIAWQSPDLEMLPILATSTMPGLERTRSADVSADVAVAAGLRVQVSAYTRAERSTLRFDGAMPRLVNGVVRTPVATNLWLNALDVRARGVEVTVRRAAAGVVNGWVSYGYGSTRNTDRATGQRYPGDFDQRHQVNAYASARLGARTSVGAKFRYGSNFPLLAYVAGSWEALRPGVTRNAVRLPAYARLDLRAGRTFLWSSRRITLFAEVLNALDRDNIGRTTGSIRTTGVVSGYTESLFPRIPSAGIRLEF